MPSSVVSWQFSPANTPSLRLLVYAAIGLTVGPVLGLVVLVGATLVAGGVGVALLALALALLVGLGVGSGRALFALGHAPPEAHETVRALSRRGVGVALLVGMGVGAGGLLWTDVGLELLVGSVVTGVLLLSFGAGLRTRGAVDRRAGTVTYGGHTVPLAAVRRVRAIAVGPFVCALVGYHRERVGPSTPRWFVLSAAAHDAIESARRSIDERGVEATGTDDAGRTPRAVRWVAAAFGVGCLLSGPALWYVLSTEPHPFATFLGLFAGSFGLLFGVVFLRYALVA